MNLLAPIGKLYGFGMDVRNFLYDHGILPSYSLGARTISIGNLTTGGTGKTPLVGLAARILADDGSNVCILSRGYGRQQAGERVVVSDGKSLLADAFNGGDEPVELARSLNGKAVVIADADRVAAARWAREQFKITTFVLDDGFQHRRAKRDLNILCIDATNPLGNGQILPAVPLRESLRGLDRAQAAVITRSDLIGSPHRLVKQLRDHRFDAPVFLATSQKSTFTSFDDFAEGRSANNDGEARGSVRSGFVFTGIGNPAGFHAQLFREHVPVAGTETFPDHHYYTQADIDLIQRKAGSAEANCLLTTAKDAVKLLKLRFDLPVFVVESRIEIDDEVEFRSLIIGKKVDL